MTDREHRAMCAGAMIAGIPGAAVAGILGAVIGSILGGIMGVRAERLTLAEATIAYALTQVGVQEHPRGSNCGPEVERYLAFVNLPKGKAWCAAFVSYSTLTQAADLSMTSTLKPSGGALALYFKNHDLAIDQPTDNCIGIIDHGQGLGHAFFIETAGPDSCHTVEGNTDPAGGREGYMVAERDRPTSSITYFLRIA